jgi:hypothetical protein
VKPKPKRAGKATHSVVHVRGLTAFGEWEANVRINTNPTAKGHFMKKTNGDGPVAGPLPDFLEFPRLVVSLGNAYVRLGARDRLKVMRALKEFAFGKANTASYWDLWSKDDAACCYTKLKPISPKMASLFRRWASEILRIGRNNKLALKCLMEELEVRTWIEEP